MDIKIKEEFSDYLRAKEDAEKFVNELVEKEMYKENCLNTCTEEPRPTVNEPAGKTGPQPIVNKEDIGKSTPLIILIVIGVIAFFLILALGNADKESRTSQIYDHDSVTTENIVEKEEIPSVKEWIRTTEKDEMTDTENVWMKLASDNSISQEFPYETTYCTITARYMKKYGIDAIISISSGQIHGSEYNNENYVMVRFDDAKPIKYWFNEPSDNSSDAVFIRKASDFISRCKKATNIKVEVPLYQHGRPVFSFKVDKPLKWER